MTVVSRIKQYALLLLLFITAVTSYFGFLCYEIYMKPLMHYGVPSEFTINKKETIRQVARRMRSNGYIRSSELFVYAFLAHNDQSNLYSGNYIIYPHDTLYRFIQRVSKAQVLQEAFTIVEGWTWPRLWDALNTDTRILHSSEAAVKEFFEQLDGNAKLFSSLEGAFLPDTYHFSSGVRDIDVLAHAYTAKDRLIQQAWQQRKPALKLKTPYQAIVIASLIERESRYPPEFSHISSVIHNRLKKNMPIQIDAAVLYGRDKRIKGPLTVKDLRKDSPFNTYTRKGLPPSPISFPSRRAILAALNPDEGDDLFYLAMPNGRHYFSKTFYEHKLAKKRYIKGKSQ